MLSYMYIHVGDAEMEDHSGASRPRLGSTNQSEATSVNSTTGAGSSQVDRGLTATGVSSTDLTTVGKYQYNYDCSSKIFKF